MNPIVRYALLLCLGIALFPCNSGCKKDKKSSPDTTATAPVTPPPDDSTPHVATTDTLGGIHWHGQSYSWRYLNNIMVDSIVTILPDTVSALMIQPDSTLLYSSILIPLAGGYWGQHDQDSVIGWYWQSITGSGCGSGAHHAYVEYNRSSGNTVMYYVRYGGHDNVYCGNSVKYWTY